MLRDDKISWIVMLRDTGVVALAILLNACAPGALSPLAESQRSSTNSTAAAVPAPSSAPTHAVAPEVAAEQTHVVSKAEATPREAPRRIVAAASPPESAANPLAVTRETPAAPPPEPVAESPRPVAAPAVASTESQDTSDLMDHAKNAVSLGDFSRAAQFYEKAADAGNSSAMILLGDLYANGRGVKTDYNQAAKLYQNAQKAGHTAAAGRLAYMTIQGWGVPKSVSKGVELLQAAANKGDAFSRGKLGTLILRGMVESQLWVCGPVAQPCVPERVIPLFQQGAKESDPESMYQLGELYRAGRGVALDSQQAVRLFKLAADLGEPRGQHSLGMMYLTGGESVPQEPEKGLIWVRSAASQGLAEAQNALGVIYVEGKVIPPNTKEAVTWYQRAAEQGHPVAQANLASMYRYGKGVKRDLITAYKWYSIASQQFLTTNVGMRVASDISRRALEASMTPKDVERARSEANTWLERYRSAEAPRVGS